MNKTVPETKIDRELVDAFLLEGRETLSCIQESLTQWQQSPKSNEPVKSLQRALHLLKGSARLAGWDEIGDLSSAFKTLVQAGDEGDVSVAAVTAVVANGVKRLQQMCETIDADQPLAPANDILDEVNQLLESAGLERVLVDVSLLDDNYNEENAQTQKKSAMDDESLKWAFLQEGRATLDSIDNILKRCEQAPLAADLTEALQREFHILKGSSKLAGWDEIGDLSDAVKTLLSIVNEQHIAATADLQIMMQQVVDSLSAMFALVKVDEVPAPADDLIAQFNAMSETFASQDIDDDDNAIDDSVEVTEDLDDIIDPDLLEVFLEEAEEIMADSEQSFEQWRADPNDTAPVSALQRYLHTLKGGARMAGFIAIGDLSHGLESLFIAIVEEQRLQASENMFEVLQRCHDQLARMLDQAKAGQKPQADKQLEADVQRLLSGQTVATTQTNTETEAMEAVDLNEANEAIEADVDEEIDPELLEVFLEESDEIMSETEQAFVQWQAQPDNLEPVSALQRQLHTLKGGARMAGFDAIGDLSHALESLFIAIVEEKRLQASENMFTILQRCQDQLATMLEQAKSNDKPVADDALVSEVEQLLVADAAAVETSVEIDPDMVEIFMEEAEELLESAQVSLQQLIENPQDKSAAQQLQRDMHTIKGGARMSGMMAMGDLGHVFESLMESVTEGQGQVSGNAFAVLQRVLDRLAGMRESILADVHAQLPAETALINEVKQLLQPVSEAVDSSETTSSPEAVSAVETETVAEPEEVDEELLEVFLEEADDILASSEKALQRWPSEPENKVLIEELQRYLHTLKGGARMANLTAMGDLSHVLETALIAVGEGGLKVSTQLMNIMQRAYDQLVVMVEQTKAKQPSAAPTELLAEVEQLFKIPATSTTSTTPVESIAAIPEKPKAAKEKPKSAKKEPAKATQRAPQELIRVRAETLDHLVNNAGEISIYRSRLEQQVTEFRFNFSEMEQTVSRLRQQLRNLEIETEAQVIARHVDEVEVYADFDPLEMDQYSTLQQLSRSLTETVSDLISIQSQLEGVARDSEILLLQQARVNTDLQEGLMGTRMVPFSNHESRMRRIIRQTCQTLKKKAELRFEGADIELDRTMLDRIMAPLEHMLRNAISHGIEAPSQRTAKGKPETGTILINLAREGTEMVIRFHDDGAGINADAVRKKAIERGLMKSAASLPDREVMQFILETGFSTAEKVSQVAGRGVGMDVVNSEIKQLNGSLEIDSTRGKGSTFTIRLPSTLSVNQALLVVLGEEQYAVPLDSVEGVVRLSKTELLAYAEDESLTYPYAGQDYEVQYLGRLLAASQKSLDMLDDRVPVILVRTAEHRVAIYVDAILGSREVVVKPVGVQISAVQGIAGATILADGHVVLILDLVALIRSNVAQRVIETAVEDEPVMEAADVKERTLVMVVDDSLTVRKVTTRLLERHDLDVMTAKDGVEALTLLQDHMPDVMLLDVEMPRMDGFELATHIRNDDRLRPLPIIMITSRQGQKHRTRAEKIGVNRYLGKPYQESDLLENIHTLVSEHRGNA